MEQTPKTPPAVLCDLFGRRLHYLRLSVTDRCNLRCTYCMPQGGVPKLPHAEILSLEELARVAQVAVSLGVDKIRITGGEPLLRRDLPLLLLSIHGLKPRPDLRLTTNGRLLEAHLPDLLASGVSTVNVSLDTLRPERYGAITGLDEREGAKAHAEVWRGIHAALDTGRIAVKINVVLLADQNRDELAAFARLSQDLPLAVRFIEYMPVGRRTPFSPGRFLAASQVTESLEGLGPLEPLPSRPGDGPAQRFRLAGAKGELGLINALSSHFCATCNRLRLSAEGLLVPCLFSDQTLDLKTVLRGGGDDEALAAALKAAAALKPRHHMQTPAGLQHSGCAMSRLGG